MTDRAQFQERLAAVAERLRAHRELSHQGVTEPDPGATEQWHATQVWAHLAEFIPYWIGQLRTVCSAYTETPIPFGRTKTDEARIAAIETGQYRPESELWQLIAGDIGTLDAFLVDLSDSDWRAVGRHPTLGVMDAPRIVEEFLVGHLEEHAAQLDGLHGAK